MLQSVIQVLQVWIGYSEMMIFMLFDIWLCTACCVGAGFGYFAFGWDTGNEDSMDLTDYCG